MDTANTEALDFRELCATIENNLSTRPAAEAAEPGLRSAAVAIVLFERENRAHYCLIKRAKRGRNSGQWALPGGKVEAGESLDQAALREAEEEVSLPSSRARMLGRLDDIITTSGFVMSPFVVASPAGWRPSAAAREVAGVFEFPIVGLLGSDVEHWATVDEGPKLLQLRIADGARIHAPTGAVLWQFSQLGLQGIDVSVQGLRQPEFTRR